MEDTCQLCSGEFNGKRVFAKIYGFPPWLARIVGSSIEPGKCRVEFQDGSIGENASILELSLENLSTLLKSGKYKKSGSSHSKARFVNECEKWGLNC